MLSRTGVFKTAVFRIPVKALNKPIPLWFFGDIHKLSPAHAEDEWKEYVAGPVNDREAYHFGMGDYTEFFSTTERVIIGNVHESTQDRLEKVCIAGVSEIVDDLKPAQGRIVGLIEGNHWAMLADGRTTTQLIASALDTNYLGAMALVRLVFEHRKESATIDLNAHHGMGAARLPGGSLNRVVQMAEAIDADLYAMGHDHKSPGGSRSSLVPVMVGNGLQVRSRKQLFIRTGSFTKHYIPDVPSYVVDRAMGASTIGPVCVRFIPGRSKSRGFHVDMRAEI